MMNEHNSKKILFNKTTLFSLKAELIKKQEEVYEKKQQPQNKLENFKPTPARATDRNESKHKKSFKDNLKNTDAEEIEACRKSKLALEKKTVLYEHLSDTSGSSHFENNFLVNFNAKKKDTVKQHSPDIAENNVQSDNDDDNEWTEFTDCLGRTRKCHKSDLELYMKRDRELIRAMNKDNANSDHENSEQSEPIVEKPFLVQKTKDYLQSLREKWEKQEQELLGQDKDIHYQDILFDEARMHGVGYYSFSTDEAERQKQMEELKKTREQTLQAQIEAEEIRKKRDELMAARVAAAKARRRIRAGLPPEDPNDNNKDFTACLLEFLTQQRDEADAKAKEKEKLIKEAQEKERQKLRESYVREWDIGKESTNEKPNKFRVMSQEEYVEQQRAKRINDFAPPSSSFNKNCSNIFDNTGKMSSQGTTAEKKTWADVMPKTPPPSDFNDYADETNQKGLYFSTAKQTKDKNSGKYANFVKVHEPTPIVNEINNEINIEDNRTTLKRTSEIGAEIAPPATYEYYGPTPKISRSQKPFESDIKEAYAKGIESLQTKSTGKQLPKHYDFTFD